MDSSASPNTSLNATAATKEADSLSSNSAFEEVSFVRVHATYPPSEDIEVQFSIGQSVETSSRDWIGLYKVGWKTPKDYYTFEWAPSRNGDAQPSTVVFHARRLPRDEASSYQFCYVTKSGEVRGVSTPFQVKDYVDEDLECIEVHDDNLESLVLVNSRTVDGRVEHYREQNAMLESTMQRTKAEYSVLQEQLELAERNVATLEQEKKTLSERVEEATRATNERLVTTEEQRLQLQSELENAVRDVSELRDELKKRTTAAEQEVQSCRAENEELKAALSEQAYLMTAAQERSAALGQECEELKLMIQEQSSELSTVQLLANESQLNHVQIQQVNEELTAELFECQKITADKDTLLLSQEAERDRQLEEERQKMEGLESQISALQMQVSELEQELQIVKAAQESSASDINLCNISELMGERAEMEQDLKMARQRVAQLEEEASQPKAADEGPLYALRTAYNHAEQQRDEITRERDALRQQLRVQRAQQATVHSLEDEAAELRGKCQDLERRLEMGAQAYKEKFMEWRITNKQLEQLKDKQDRTTLPESDQVKQLSQQLADARTELSSAEQQRATLEQAVAAQSEERDVMERAHRETMIAVQAENDSKITALNTELEEQQATVQELRHQCDEQSGLIQSLMSTQSATRPAALPAMMHDRARPTPQFPAQYSRDRPTVVTEEAPAMHRNCPVCQLAFSVVKSQSEFEQHVNSHFTQ